MKYDLNEHLTEHFQLREFMVNESISDLTLEVYKNLKLTAKAAEEIRGILGCPIRITSGWRSPAHQIRVYNNMGIFDLNDIPMESYHIKGLAFDGVTLGMAVLKAINKLSDWRGGLEIQAPKGPKLEHIHADLGPRRRFFGSN